MSNNTRRGEILKEISFSEFCARIKIGFGLLFHTTSRFSRGVQKITGSFWNHVAISVKKEWIKHALWEGVVRTSLKQYLKCECEILVWSVKDASREDHVEAALRVCDYSNRKYPVLQLPLMHYAWKYGKDSRWYRVLLLYNKIFKAHTCSELIGQGWQDIEHSMNLTPDTDLALVAPGQYDPKVNSRTKLEFRIRISNGKIYLLEEGK